MSTSSRLALHWQVLIGLALRGVRLGKHSVWLNDFTLDYIQPIGDIFINILKLIAVPLVLFSIIGGVASLGDVKKLGRLGAKTLGLYLLTTFFAVTLGLVLVNVSAWRRGERLSQNRQPNPLRTVAGRQRHRGPDDLNFLPLRKCSCGA